MCCDLSSFILCSFYHTISYQQRQENRTENKELKRDTYIHRSHVAHLVSMLMGITRTETKQKLTTFTRKWEELPGHTPKPPPSCSHPEKPLWGGNNKVCIYITL